MNLGKIWSESVNQKRMFLVSKLPTITDEDKALVLALVREWLIENPYYHSVYVSPHVKQVHCRDGWNVEGNWTTVGGHWRRTSYILQSIACVCKLPPLSVEMPRPPKMRKKRARKMEVAVSAYPPRNRGRRNESPRARVYDDWWIDRIPNFVSL